MAVTLARVLGKKKKRKKLLFLCTAVALEMGSKQSGTRWFSSQTAKGGVWAQSKKGGGQVCGSLLDKHTAVL